MRTLQEMKVKIQKTLSVEKKFWVCYSNVNINILYENRHCRVGGKFRSTKHMGIFMIQFCLVEYVFNSCLDGLKYQKCNLILDTALSSLH